MKRKFFDAIKEYDTIIIHRHSRPDLDAIGSQRGLALTLKHAYPNKKIYVVGDVSKKYEFLTFMDQIEDDVYSDALVIITDVSVKNMVSDLRFELAKEVFIIDHHKNPSDITTNVISDTSRIAACELIADLLLEEGYRITPDAATALFGGIVTDSGRFQYGETSSRTLRISAELLDLGADKEYIYSNIYTETLAERQMKNYFAARFNVTEAGVAYLKNGPEVFEKFNVDFFSVSRGMVNTMAGIEEIKIWCNFTYDKSTGKVIGEFRSRGLSIVDIAKKYGGGGHDQACGATLADFEEADKVLADFDRLLK